MPDTQTLGLVIAGGIAGLVCLRLYWVLGRRTGEEPQAQSQTQPLRPAARSTVAPPPLAPIAGGNGLLDIQMADHNFDTTKFLTGARQSYGRIVAAFAQGDRAELAGLVSPDVLAAFESAIAARKESPPAFDRLTDARIAAAALDGRQAEITVSFAALFAGGTVTDVWSFARNLDSSDPNWLLVATSGDLPD